MRRYTLDEAEDLLLGNKGTPLRDQYEFELKLELIGDMIQQARKERNLTQEELGKIIGVKKSQISRLENKTGNITLETILKVFNALGAKIIIKLEMQDHQLNLG